MEESKPLIAVWIETNQVEELRSGEYDANDEWRLGEWVGFVVDFFSFSFCFLFFL